MGSAVNSMIQRKQSLAVRIRQVGSDEREVWDAFVEGEGSFALLQSWNWGTFKEELGWKASRIVVEDGGRIVGGAQLLVKPLPLGLSIAYVPRGPLGDWLTDEVARPLFSELICLARQNGAIFLKIEPALRRGLPSQGLLERYGFRHSRTPNQPQTTIVLDLTQSEDDILAHMRKKTRQYVRRAEREGITVRLGTSEDLPAFENLMHLTATREHFAARTSQYYRAEWETVALGGKGALFLAYHGGQLIAARLVYRFGRHAAEFHAGSVTISGLHPNYLLVWEAIKWAKGHGCISYDLWGIPDELGAQEDESEGELTLRRDGLWGVYQFKRGFSSDVIAYVGPYDYVLRPALYLPFSADIVGGAWSDRIASAVDLFRFKSLGGQPRSMEQSDDLRGS